MNLRPRKYLSPKEQNVSIFEIGITQPSTATRKTEGEHPEHSLILAENIDSDVLQTKLELVNICEWAIKPPNE